MTVDEETRSAMDQLTVDNTERITTLAHKHIQVDVQSLMLRHLVETLFPTEEERAEIHYSFQQLLSTILDEAEQRADELILRASAVQQSGLLVPGRVG